MSGQIDIKKSLKKAYRKQRPTRAEIETLRHELLKMLGETNLNESEEYHKGLLKDFLKKNAYADYFINTKDRSDLVIHNGKNSRSSVGIIIETKRPGNKTEMPKTDNINKKATQELLLYFLRERVTKKNFEIKHLMVTNLYEWFIFDASEFEKIAENAKLKKHFKDFEEGRLLFDKTEFFYKEIAAPVLEQEKNKMEFVHFNIFDYEKHLKKQTKTGDNKLIELQKILSPIHLLKLPFANDSNTLNKDFYSELLHIIGLEEYKEKGKKLIRRKEQENRNEDSIIEATITQIIFLDKLSRITDVERFGDNVDEQLYNIGLELSITWMNRVLFLKLLESQIVSYHESKDYLFLDIEKVPEYDDLNTLFFQVLAVEKKNRPKAIQEKYPNVPYLNSSLFEPTEIEHQTIFISNLPNDTSLPLYKKTVVKSNNKKMNALEYFLRFLDAYDFSSEGKEDIAEENKTLINASVLGLIFEKINGYKDGSFFTPGFVTMYMCRETIRRCVVQKFKEQTDFDSDDFGDLVNFTTGKYKKAEFEKYNKIVNSMKICDPAVGSGHFLVSALNEIIAIKAELGILTDDSSKPLRDYLIDVENDELMILDGNGDFFKYDPKNREAQRVQETLFNEKQTIIENCLFGVDINPNSVKICRLRLWIELLKNAYYKADGELETLPNIDINIKCGNSLISRYPIDADLGHALVGSNWDIGMYRLAVMNYRNAENKEQKREAEKLIKKIKSDFNSGITENDPIRKKRKKIKEELNDLTSQGRLFEKDAFKKDKKIVKRIEILAKDIAELDAMIEEINSGAIYRNALEWRFEFPEVLDEKTGNFSGFDIVIANPPYVTSKYGKISKALKSTYSKLFESAYDKLDLYVLFIEKAVRVSRIHGFTTFITPWNFLGNFYSFKIRKFLLSNVRIKLFNKLPPNVFGSVIVDNIISVFERDRNNKGNQILFDDLFDSNSRKHVNQDIYLNNDKYVFTFPSDPAATAILEKMNLNSISLGNIALNYIGIMTGGQKKMIANSPVFKNSKPVLSGKDIDRWIYFDRGNFVNFDKSKIHSNDNEEVYLSKRKILLRKTGRKLVGCIDENQFFTIQSLYNIVVKDPKYADKYLLSLLNSKLFTYIYNKFFITNPEVFPYVKRKHLDKFPIKQIPLTDQRSYVKIVSKILAITKDVDYLENSTKQTKVAEYEKQIDQMVNKLYGLTPEEIAIVEGHCKTD